MNKIMKKLTSFLAIFTMLVFIFLAGIFSNEYNSGVDIVSLGDNYTGQLEYDADRVYNDVLDGSTGQTCLTEDDYGISLLSLDNVNNCLDNCTSHGVGRQTGGSGLLSTGCRNYEGWSYGNYGLIEIPFWINMTSMDTISDTAKRNLLIQDIRTQAALWNECVMHDGTGQIVRLYEVGVGESSLPSKINGKKVVEILRKDGNYAGQFSSSAMQIRINYNDSGSTDRAGRNLDTPVHEMGHLLGLNDLEDSDSGIPSGTHKTLMGYDRYTSDVNRAIQYQDIQGIAVLNGRHTEHVYRRYIYSGGKYLHICFYCDRIDSQSSIKSGSSAILSNTSCTHDYAPLVSAGDRHWFKCVKCYNVIEKDTSDPSWLFGGGSGTLASPYLIKTESQFRNIEFAYRSVYVPRQGSENQINYAFKLMNSITLLGDWAPFTYKFTGDFDGAGHEITYNMYLTQEDINASIYQGLFGFVVGAGKIHDLELMNCTITSDTGTTLSKSDDQIIDIGIVAGAFFEASGLTNVTVTNPKIECKISKAAIGAIAGSCYGTFATNCEVNGDAKTPSITNNTRGYLGGMAGLADSIGQFRGCSVTIVLENTDFDEDSDMMGEVIGNVDDLKVEEYNSKYNITVEVILEKGSCLAAGTLITLADGTQKPIEELTGDEMLLVWNLYTGRYDVAPILFIDCDALQNYSIINLSFSNGETVRVISEHGFWDYNLNRYVYLDRNAEQYIGHWFCSQTTDEYGNMIAERVQLLDVTIRTEMTVAYSPVTYGHLCYFVNGMLSMPGGIEGLFNIFEVDAETMSYDRGLMNDDIEQYGLFTYEEFTKLVPVSREVFEAFNGQYLKVAVGKGLIDIDTLETLVSRYAEFFI